MQKKYIRVKIRNRIIDFQVKKGKCLKIKEKLNQFLQIQMPDKESKN